MLKINNIIINRYNYTEQNKHNENNKAIHVWYDCKRPELSGLYLPFEYYETEFCTTYGYCNCVTKHIVAHYDDTKFGIDNDYPYEYIYEITYTISVSNEFIYDADKIYGEGYSKSCAYRELEHRSGIKYIHTIKVEPIKREVTNAILELEV